jgi:FkbM family methyltransferase
MKHFFDIGGNHGQTFDYLDTLDRSYTDHIFWVFEPSPRHFAPLLEKCKSFSDRYDIRVCPFGIGGTTEIRKFREKDDYMGDSFQTWHASDHEVFNIDNGYTVFSAIISLPEFIMKYTRQDDTIVLDIDTEGSEYEIMRALLDHPQALSRVKEIMVEWHHVSDGIATVLPEEVTSVCKQLDIRIVHRGDSKLLEGVTV